MWILEFTALGFFRRLNLTSLYSRAALRETFFSILLREDIRFCLAEFGEGTRKSEVHGRVHRFENFPVHLL